MGLIIGATIGLAVALAVAIYVANVPIPFVNKNATRTNGQDAAEAEKNKAWDPNAGLRSHNGALPAASTATMGTVAPQPQPVPIAPPPEAHPQTPTRTTAVPPPAEVKPTESRTASKPAERASAAVASKPAASSPTRAQSSDPLGDFAAARAGMSKPAATAPAGETSGLTYFVQAGAFRTPEELARWLADTGASAFGEMTATYEQWLATCRSGWAPSAVACGGDLVSGVEFMGGER